MARPTLTERRRVQTRREIAKSALDRFTRVGYENTSVEDIAEASGVSLRTFYRYFSSKDEVLSPIIVDGMRDLADRIAARPAEESLSTAVERAYAELAPAGADKSPGPLIALLTEVPVLRSRWLHDLRSVEEALVPIVLARVAPPITDEHARLTAAAIVTGLRVVLEASARRDGDSVPGALGDALRYLRDGARL